MGCIKFNLLSDLIFKVWASLELSLPIISYDDFMKWKRFLCADLWCFHINCLNKLSVSLDSMWAAYELSISVHIMYVKQCWNILLGFHPNSTIYIPMRRVINTLFLCVRLTISQHWFTYDGLTPTRRQVIPRNNVDPIQWHKHASLSIDGCVKLIRPNWLCLMKTFQRFIYNHFRIFPVILYMYSFNGKLINLFT